MGIDDLQQNSYIQHLITNSSIKTIQICTVKFLKGIIECQEYLSQKKFFVALDTHDLNYD